MTENSSFRIYRVFKTSLIRQGFSFNNNARDFHVNYSQLLMVFQAFACVEIEPTIRVRAEINRMV